MANETVKFMKPNKDKPFLAYGGQVKPQRTEKEIDFFFW